MTSTSGTTEERQDAAPVVVGRVLRPHGVRGALLVEPLSDNPRRFAPGSRLTARREGAPGSAVEVAGARPHGRALLVELAGLADRDAAEELRGCWLEVPAAAVPPAPEGSFYFFELVGCRCHDRLAGDLGEVVDLLEDGGGLLLLLERPGARLLVPFVERFLLRVDRAGRRIELELPPGLVETCTSPS
jgi:16S rRNA processing protein RimM